MAAAALQSSQAKGNPNAVQGTALGFSTDLPASHFPAVQLGADGEGWTSCTLAKGRGERAPVCECKCFASTAALYWVSECCWHWEVCWSSKPGEELLKLRLLPSSPPLVFRRKKLPVWLQKHLLLENMLESSDTATTSQGRLGFQAPQQIQAEMFFGVWSFAGHSFSFVAVDQRVCVREREQRKQMVCLNKGQIGCSGGSRAVLFCNEPCNAVRSHSQSPLGKVKALPHWYHCYLLWKPAQTHTDCAIS